MSVAAVGLSKVAVYTTLEYVAMDAHVEGGSEKAEGVSSSRRLIFAVLS